MKRKGELWCVNEGVSEVEEVVERWYVERKCRECIEEGVWKKRGRGQSK